MNARPAGTAARLGISSGVAPSRARCIAIGADDGVPRLTGAPIAKRVGSAKDRTTLRGITTAKRRPGTRAAHRGIVVEAHVRLLKFKRKRTKLALT